MQANGFTNDQAQGFYREAVTALHHFAGLPQYRGRNVARART